uniref:Uncharacterized protein n=1 Tax=Anguilla anguilla TaxID=7936 RepID=A0A0E9WSD5_ANGAN
MPFVLHLQDQTEFFLFFIFFLSLFRARWYIPAHCWAHRSRTHA